MLFLLLSSHFNYLFVLVARSKYAATNRFYGYCQFNNIPSSTFSCASMSFYQTFSAYANAPLKQMFILTSIRFRHVKLEGTNKITRYWSKKKRARKCVQY